MAEARRPCKRCNRNRAERFFISPQGHVCSDCRKQRVRTAARDQRLQETYGITEDEYKTLFEAQGGACAICNGKRRENLDVDHDHATGVIRGLLCKRCNRRLLPASTDNLLVLSRAMDYLVDPPATRVIGRRVAPEAPPRPRPRRRAGRRRASV